MPLDSERARLTARAEGSLSPAFGAQNGSPDATPNRTRLGGSPRGVAESQPRFLTLGSERMRPSAMPRLPLPSGENRLNWRHLSDLPHWSLPRVSQWQQEAEQHSLRGRDAPWRGSSSSPSAYASLDTSSASSASASVADAAGQAAPLLSLPPPVSPPIGWPEMYAQAPPSRPGASAQAHSHVSSPDVHASWPRHSHTEDVRTRSTSMGNSADTSRMLQPAGHPLGAGAHHSAGSLAFANAAPSSAGAQQSSLRRTAKTNVASACLNCRRAHLACDGEFRSIWQTVALLCCFVALVRASWIEAQCEDALSASTLECLTSIFEQQKGHPCRQQHAWQVTT